MVLALLVCNMPLAGWMPKVHGKTNLIGTHNSLEGFGPACLQPNLSFDVMSEDCLTVRIFRPAGLASEGFLPVTFWQYQFFTENVARGSPIIYVNYNYRLGPLGFPPGTETVIKGVTISVSEINITLWNGGSFWEKCRSRSDERAILQPLDTEDGPICSVLSASHRRSFSLRSLNLDRVYIFNHQRSLRLLVGLPSRLWAQWHFTTLPFVSGTNLRRRYSRLVIFPDSRLQERTLDLFLQLYPDDPILGSPYGTTGDQASGLQETEYHICAVQTTQTVMQAYRYHQLTQHMSASRLSWETMISVLHTSESYFVYGLSGMLHESVSSNVLSKMMVYYWVSFSTSLDPNDDLGAFRPVWPQYTPENKTTIARNRSTFSETTLQSSISKVSFRLRCRSREGQPTGSAVPSWEVLEILEVL
ncbi:hypothetical protein F5146DRAFT_997378 [Armillaria mellea]|nr:hypothetical protein F5146DRAFT_997378 [Armillaria mellea]